MKKSKFPLRKNGDFIANPIDCSLFMVQKASEAIMQNRMKLSMNTGVLQFLLSNQNIQAGMFDASQTTKQLNNPQGKKVLVRRRFRPIKTVKEITGNARNYCAPVESCVNPYKEDIINLGFDYTEQLMCFSESELRRTELGETISQTVADLFIRELVAFENTFAAVVVKRILQGDLVGNFKGGDAIRDLPLYMANGLTLNPSAMVYVNQWLSEVGVNEAPALVGGARVSAYNQVRKFASANHDGFDPSMGESITPILDYSVPDVFGNANHALLIAPGALHLFTENLHVGEFVAQENDPNSRRYTLTSPLTGIKWDAYWQRARNCNTGDWEWTINLGLIWDIVGLPSCWSADACMAGVLDVWKVNVVCADTGVCAIEGDSCIDTANLPLHSNTIEFPTPGELCAQSCRVLINTRQTLNARRHSLSTASTADAIGLQYGGSTLNFDAPITLGTAPGIAALKLAVQEAIGTSGVVVSGAYSAPNTTISIISDGSIAGVTLILAGAADLEFTTITYAKVCRVTTISRPSTGATVSTIGFTNGTMTITAAAPGTAVAKTDAVGIVEDFFVFGETEAVFGATITVTLTDSAACTDVESIALCTD